MSSPSSSPVGNHIGDSKPPSLRTIGRAFNVQRGSVAFYHLRTCLLVNRKVHQPQVSATTTTTTTTSTIAVICCLREGAAASHLESHREPVGAGGGTRSLVFHSSNSSRLYNRGNWDGGEPTRGGGASLSEEGDEKTIQSC